MLQNQKPSLHMVLYIYGIYRISLVGYAGLNLCMKIDVRHSLGPLAYGSPLSKVYHPLAPRSGLREATVSRCVDDGSSNLQIMQEFVNRVKEEICKVLCVVCPSA